MNDDRALPLRVPLALAGCALLLVGTAAAPGRALDDARAALVSTGSGEPFAALVPVVALLAWVLLLWLSATVVLTVAGELPGALGRCAAGAAGRVAPVAVRRAVQLALGLSLAAGVGVGGTASAAPLAEAPGTAISAPSLDWPTGARPTPTPPVPPADGTVLVAPGDTLWSLAARSLGTEASARQIAATWPAWWSANRDVIGADPDLLHPGDRLTPPS